MLHSWDSPKTVLGSLRPCFRGDGVPIVIYVLIKSNQIGSMPSVTRCYYGSWVTVRLPWGVWGSLPGYLKRAVEDKLDRYSDKTFHYTTSATYANDLDGLKAS